MMGWLLNGMNDRNLKGAGIEWHLRVTYKQKFIIGQYLDGKSLK